MDNKKSEKTMQQTATNFIDNLISDTTKQVAALKALIFNAPETNQAKIEFIKEELATGKYQIDSYVVATKLLEHAQLQVTEEQAEIA